MSGGKESGISEREMRVGERSGLGAVRMHAGFYGWATWQECIGA